MRYDIDTREVQAEIIMSIRQHVPAADLPAFIGRSFGDLFAHARLLSIPVVGEPLAIYHAFGPGTIDAEIGLPVAGRPEATGRITIRQLPAMTVVETVHVGSYEELGGAYAALEAWIGDHGYEKVGPVTERYLDGPGTGAAPAAYRTMVAMPIARVPMPVA